MNVANTLTMRILRSVMETYSAQMVRIIGTLLFNIWLTRLLAPTQRGYYAVGLAVAMMAVQFGQIGLNTANTYFVAKEPQIAKVLLGNSTIAALIIAPVLILIIIIASRLAPFSVTTPYACLIVALSYIPFALGYLFLQGILLGTYKIRTFNMLEILNRYIPLGMLGLLVVLREVTATTVLCSIVIGQTVACIGAWISLYAHSDRLSYSMPLMVDTLRYGARIHLATVFAFILFRMDLLMVAHMRNSEEAGYYSLATSLAEYMSLPASVAGMILLPHLSSLRESSEKFHLMLQWLCGIAAITAPLFIISGYIGYPVIRSLFGQRYLPSLPGFIALLPGIYFLGLACVAVQFISSIGYKLSVSLAWLFALMLNLSGNLYAIPRYGFIGASAMSSICYTLAFSLILLIAWQHRKSETLSPRSEPSTIHGESGVSYMT